MPDEKVPVERHWGWEDMAVPPQEDPRSQDPTTGERATVLAYLSNYRQTLQLKCRGLDAEGMARRSCPPSDMSLLGLVRHMADVEQHWFRRVLDGQDVAAVFRTEDDRDAAFSGAQPDPAQVEEAWAAWRAEVDFGDRFVEQAEDLSQLSASSRHQRFELRDILIHLIEEYARHCGHADLIRERIDGAVGQ